jgi:hypothetical protein
MSRTAIAAIDSDRKTPATEFGHHEARGIEDLLLDGLADRVAARILERLGETQSAAKRLLTMEQAGEYLGRSKDSVQHLVSFRKITDCARRPESIP